MPAPQSWPSWRVSHRFRCQTKWSACRRHVSVHWLGAREQGWRIPGLAGSSHYPRVMGSNAGSYPSAESGAPIAIPAVLGKKWHVSFWFGEKLTCQFLGLGKTECSVFGPWKNWVLSFAPWEKLSTQFFFFCGAKNWQDWFPPCFRNPSLPLKLFVNSCNEKLTCQFFGVVEKNWVLSFCLGTKLSTQSVLG